MTLFRALPRFACLLGMAAPLVGQSVAEYAPVSMGVQVDYNRSISPDVTPVQSGPGAGNLVGQQLDTLYGAAVVAQVRLGEVINWKLRHFTLQPALGIRIGSDKDTGTVPSYTGNQGTLTAGTFDRHTKTAESYLNVPLRWYVGSRMVAVEGFFLEAGPGWSRTRQKVDVTVTGAGSGGAGVLSDDRDRTQNNLTWNFGMGISKAMGSTLLTSGVAYQKLSKPANLGGSYARVFFQWNF